MPKVIIDVWSDYVCPFCYLEMPVLEELRALNGVEVAWHSFELRPEPVPTLDPKGDYLARTWKGSVHPLAAERGMKLRLPRVQPRSRRAFETAEFARAKGKFAEMHLALFKAFFEAGKNIGETSVLLQLAAEIGLPPAQLLGSFETRENVGKIVADQKLAARLKIPAVPGFSIHRAGEPVEQGRILTGAVGVDEMRQVVRSLGG